MSLWAWAKAKVDNKPWWAIILASALGAMGAEIVKNSPAYFSYIHDFFPQSARLIISIRHSNSEKPIPDAEISIVDQSTLQKIPLGAENLTSVKSSEFGLAEVDLIVLPNKAYVLLIEIRFEGRLYRYTDAMLIDGIKQVSAHFEPDRWGEVGDGKVQAAVQLPSEVPVGIGALPVWMNVAYAELGQTEIPGNEDNKRIVEYLKVLGSDKNYNDETPWDSAYVNWVMKKSGITGSNSLTARSWLNWGRSQTPPSLGCVAVFWRNQIDGPFGHVGFYIGQNAESYLILGGNQNNSVSISAFPKSRFLGCRVI